MRRFEVGFAPTLENALAALEILSEMKQLISKKEAPSRADALKADETSREVDRLRAEWLARGNAPKVATPYVADNCVRRARLKHVASSAKTGSELLAALKLTPREEYK